MGIKASYMKFKIVNYEEKFGEYEMPDGAVELLKTLPIEKQAEYFYTVTIVNPIPLDKNSDVKALIVDNGIIVGIMIADWSNYPTPCFINDSVCTWDSEDNNGAGYKCRTEYTSLYIDINK